MFLLNNEEKFYDIVNKEDLQYKMFLLNGTLFTSLNI